MSFCYKGHFSELIAIRHKYEYARIEIIELYIVSHSVAPFFSLLFQNCNYALPRLCPVVRNKLKNSSHLQWR